MSTGVGSPAPAAARAAGPVPLGRRRVAAQSLVEPMGI